MAKINVPYKSITITHTPATGGEPAKTHFLVDGEEYGRGATSISFSHESGGDADIRITSGVKFYPARE